MAAKRYRSISPHKTSNEATTSTADNVSKLKICVICGDNARYVNYGALSCQSCKTFFRRNGYRPEAVRPCLLNKTCEVNMQTRHNCTACRLAKCLAMGMASELIRKEDCKRPKLSPSTENKPSPTINPPPTSRVPPDDAQLLSESQWSLLTNIVHSYDTFNMIPRVRQAIETLATCVDGATPNVISPVEIIDQMCTSMQRFISSSPDFRVLTRTEQESLLERNLFGVVAFYSTYVFRQSGMLNSSHYLSAFVAIYGVDAISALNRIIDQLDVDDTVLKIVLLAFAFSSNCVFVNSESALGNDSLLHGTFRLLGSQNVYADLLWNYLVYHYGANQAALRFTRLVQLFLCMVKNLASLYSTNDLHRQISDQALDRTKRMLATTESEHTLLWGKDATV